MTQTALEILKAARAKIEKPECWTQGAYNRNAMGIPFVSEDSAVCWCAEGAILSVSEDETELLKSLFLLQEAAEGGITTFNDKHTHAEVLAVFDAAIERAKSVTP